MGISFFSAKKAFWTFAVILLAHTSSVHAAPPLPPCLEGSSCVPSEEPYDLSRFDIPFEYAWPEPPQTSRTIEVVAGSISSLQAAVSTPGARVIVPAGTYRGNLNFASDVDIVADNGARWVMSFDATCSNTHRVRWTGGVIDGENFAHHFFWFRCNDWLFDNVRFDDLSGLYPFNGESGHRFAMINSSGRFTNYAFFSLGASTGTRTKYSNGIIANCDFEGGYPSGAEATVRWQRVDGGIVVDSRLWNGAKHSLRTHYGSRNIFAHSNQMEGGSLQAHYTDGGGGDTASSNDFLGAHYTYENTYYKRNAGLNIQRGPNGSRDFDGPVIIQNNRAYHVDQSDSSGEEGRRFATPLNSGDVSSNNVEYPYRTPPAFNGGADH